MKRTTIILAGLMLFFGVSPALASAEANDRESAAMLANDAGLSLEGLRRDMGLVYDVPRASVAGQPAQTESDEGLLSCHFTDGCGYVVNPQVAIDLQYRMTASDTPSYNFANNDRSGDIFAPNVTLGFRYSF
jgi:hypothetical protein